MLPGLIAFPNQNIYSYHFSQTEPRSLILGNLRQNTQISGTYGLIKLDNKFGDFMESLGMQRKSSYYYLPKDEILQTFTVIEETPTDPSWTMVIINSKNIIIR